MCWSKNVSLLMAGIGMFFTYYSYKYINTLWSINIFYFVLMQLIHYFGYVYIDDCNNSMNKIVAYSNYIHVCFQPFFFLLGFYGLFKTYKIITKQQLSNLYFIIKLTFIVGIFSLMRLIPINFNSFKYELKETGCVWCGKPCSFSGNRHVSFSVPLRNRPYYLTPGHYFHFMFFFIIFMMFNFKTLILSILMYLSSLLPVILYETTAAEGAALWCGIVIIQFIISFFYIFILKKKKL